MHPTSSDYVAHLQPILTKVSVGDRPYETDAHVLFTRCPYSSDRCLLEGCRRACRADGFAGA